MARQQIFVDPDFPKLLKSLRKQRNLTLRDVAARAYLSHTQVWELEKGSKQPSPETGAALDRALDANGALSVLVSIGTQPVSRPPSDAGILGEVAFAFPPVPDPSVHGGRLAPATIAGLAFIAAQYRMAYQALPSSALLPAAVAHLKLVMSIRPDQQPAADREMLLTTAGEMAALAAALLCLDANQRAAAEPYLRFAWGAARAVDDIELQAVVLCGRSFVISYGTGDHRAGLEYADLAREVAVGGASSETRAWVAAVASERAAAIGDASACQIRLDESRAVLAGRHTENATWRGIGGFDASKLRAYEGGNMLRLSRFDDARQILNEALEGLDATMYRHRATAFVDRAETHLGAGDVDAACADANAALTIVTHVQHAGNLDRINAVAERIAAAGLSSGQSLRREVQLARADQGLSI